MDYAAIKNFLQVRSPQALTGGIVNTTSGSPISEIAMFLHLTNMEIALNPHKFSFLLREATINLTGATDYNLRTLIPDLAMVYQLSSPDNGQPQVGYSPLNEFNILSFSGGPRATLIGKTLRLGEGFSSGTLVIPYYSNYLVQDVAGVRKLYFEDDDDESILSEELMPVLMEGAMRFVYAKENVNKGNANQYTRKMLLWNGQLADLDPFVYLLQQATQNDRPVAKGVYDFRFIP